MNKIEVAYGNDSLKFARCIDFLVRMIEKYSNTILPATTEDIRAFFSVRQCKKAT